MSADYDRGWDTALTCVLNKIDAAVEAAEKRLRGEVPTGLSKERVEGYIADMSDFADQVERWLVTPRATTQQKGK